MNETSALNSHSRPPYVLAALLLAPTTLAEVALVLDQAVAGAMLHTALVLVYSATYLALGREPLERQPGPRGGAFAPVASLLPALTLASIIRLLSLSFSTDSISAIYWYAPVGTLSIVSALLAARALGLRPRDIGLRVSRMSIGTEALFGLLGLPLAVLGYIALSDSGPLRAVAGADPFVLAVTLVAFVGFMEELVFRGVIQRVVSPALPDFAWLWGSGLYGIMLLGTRSIAFTLFFILAGMIFSLWVRRSGSILGTSVAHGILRLGLLLVLPGFF